MTHPPARGSGAEDQQAGDHSGQHRKLTHLNWVGCDSPLVSRKLIQAHGRQCLGTSNATSKGSDYSFRPLTNSLKSVDPYPTRGSIPAAQYGKALGNAAAVPQQPRPNPDTTTRSRKKWETREHQWIRQAMRSGRRAVDKRRECRPDNESAACSCAVAVRHRAAQAPLAVSRARVPCSLDGLRC